LEAEDLRDQVLRMVYDEVDAVVDAHTHGPDPEEWDLRGLQGDLRSFFPLPSNFDFGGWEDASPDEIKEQLEDLAARAYDDVNRAVGHEVYRQAVREDVSLKTLAESADPAQQTIYRRIVKQLKEKPSDAGGSEATPSYAQSAQPLYQLPDETQAVVEQAFVDAYRLFRDRQLMLQAVDSLWVRHLTNLGDLREGIGLRAYGQQNPLVAYRKEAHETYQDLLARIQQRVARSVFLLPRALAPRPAERPLRTTHRPVAKAPVRSRSSQAMSKGGSGQTGDVRPDCELGRNDPCWCGSGKKYKHCHMRKDEQAKRTRAAAAR
jgi:preprotein translocase subunit SecA